ncbi:MULTISPECIES: hypothetical protein [Aliivibrio]|uniref:Uncharacterized protein n=1 Tax=Aliivibrio finisterrensis TaxID=511998 RepID=A0A4Q5KV61_9GAMM|nr:MULTISPECIES: hypothetical protein [Aliivibrio]MDD9176302.1 hypothetical protein [Aliivibrio sp. S3TY1]MDD9177918.1 hypothetical protein [Aliivibrio sp. A6]MDD9193319.1 hypothetical protein [Aliivibrio sp. S2TY2]RYU45532.1 hypothetical protein ERW49_13510 [Aliivibrio finisterrensis]RYU52262.1 hypothetical protein ERW57_07135 [Aliivibrio finisterrensis]
MDFNCNLIGYILAETEGLSPEGRFLLLCLLYEYSMESKEIDISVEQLVSKYGVTRTVCSEVSKFLSLPKNKLAKIRRSKVRCCEFDSVSLSKFSSDFDNGQYGNVHRFTVVDLLTRKSTVDGVKNECDLSVSNLLLLIILLIHSDSSGSVEGVSKTKIRKMMGGISADRLKSQLKTLNKVKYILVDSRGGTGRKLFGKVSNNYVLNIGKLQGKGEIVEKEIEIESNSVLYDVKLMTRDMQQVIPFIKKLKDGERKSLLHLFGDDADRYMDITRILINKCECLISIILKQYWGELDDLTVADCQFLDDPRMKAFLTARSLFSMKYIYDVRKPKDKEEKTRYLEEVLVTNDSFNKFCFGGAEIKDDLIIEAHYLIEFLLTHSIAIAVKVKHLLISHPKYENNEIKNIAIGFGTIVMNGINRNSYDLVVSLRDTEGYRIYSILALVSKKEARKYDCRINLTTWKCT